MRTRTFVVVFFAVVIAPAIAAAKGADSASITGQGLAAPIAVTGTNAAPDALPTLAEQSGLYAAVFAEQPDPMLAAPPTQDLGPRLDVAWHIPTSQSTADVVHQDIYPYADGGPVTYVAAGQPFFETNFTHGGWYRAPATLLATLTHLGVPSREVLEAGIRPAATTPPEVESPASHAASPRGLALVAVGAILVGAVVLARVMVGIRRRRHAVAV